MPSDEALAGWGGVPGSHETWLVVFTKLMQIQFSHQCLDCDHFTHCPNNTAASHYSPWGNAWPVTISHNALRASHYLPQACKFPRAAQEWLCCRFWVTVYHPNLPRPSLTVLCYKRPPWLVGQDQSTRHPECHWQFSCRGTEFQGAKGFGQRFLQSQCSLSLCAEPTTSLPKCPENTMDSHHPSQAWKFPRAAQETL